MSTNSSLVYVEERLSGAPHLVDPRTVVSLPREIAIMPGYDLLKARGLTFKAIVSPRGAVVTDAWDKEGRQLPPSSLLALSLEGKFPISKVVRSYPRLTLAKSWHSLRLLADQYPNGLVVKDGDSLVDLRPLRLKIEIPDEPAAEVALVAEVASVEPEITAEGVQEPPGEEKPPAGRTRKKKRS